MADIVEQRKLILDDSPVKSEEEVKGLLKKANFDLSRSYQVVRGLNSTAYIQDIDVANPKRERSWDDPFFGKVFRREVEVSPGAVKEVVNSPAGQRITAIIELLKAKVERSEPLTPIELMIAELFVQGKRVVNEHHAKDGKCPGCDHKDHGN